MTDPLRTVHSAGGVVVSTAGGQASIAVVAFEGMPDDHWVLPKGPVADGEDPRAGALRVVREQTGLACRTHEALQVVWDSQVSAGRRVVKRLECWRMSPTGGELQEEHADGQRRARWMPLRTAAGTLAYQVEREMAAEVARLLGIDLT